MWNGFLWPSLLKVQTNVLWSVECRNKRSFYQAVWGIAHGVISECPQRRQITDLSCCLYQMRESLAVGVRPFKESPYYCTVEVFMSFVINPASNLRPFFPPPPVRPLAKFLDLRSLILCLSPVSWFICIFPFVYLQVPFIILDFARFSRNAIRP